MELIEVQARLVSDISKWWNNMHCFLSCYKSSSVPESLGKTNKQTNEHGISVQLRCLYHRIVVMQEDHNTNICLYECVPPKFIRWNLVSSVMVWGGGARGRCIGHEGGAPMNGISALVNATHGICEPESGLSPDTESADTLPLDFPASRAVRNIFLLFIKK